MLRKDIKDGLKVRVLAEATDAIGKACAKLGRKSLLGTTLTGVDPCCGCVIVEFKQKLGTDSVFYTKGKLGYCDEVEPRNMSLVGGAKAKKEATPKGSFRVGTRVQVIKTYDAAKEGMVGTVYLARLPEHGIIFDTLTGAMGGHSLAGKLTGKDTGKGQWVPPSHLAMSSPAKPLDAPPVAKPYALAVGPGNTVKVNFELSSNTSLSASERVVNKGVRYYGWLSVQQDGSTVRRVVTAPFGGGEWLCLDVEDKRITKIEPSL